MTRKTKRRRRKPNYKNISILLAIIATIIILSVRACSCDRRSSIFAKDEDVELVQVFGKVVPYTEKMRTTPRAYRELLCDSQNVQLPAAEANGINPLDDDSRVPNLVRSGRLVELSDTTLFEIQAEYPYLVPEAYNALREVLRLYREKTDSTQRLRVTGCLRTNAYVKRLMRRNVNAVQQSCHLYGTTFDISYSPLEPYQKEALARTLKEMRDAGYLYVLYERKQPCFHITLRNPGEYVPKE